MNPVKLVSISIGLVLLWSTIAHAEVAGRVLVAVGDNVAQRAGTDIKLVVGAPIEKGDTLRVGEASNLQVFFTDQAVMALRPNTTMRIDDYAFTNKAGSDKSVFNLLKGGLRTITGVIGKISRDNYAVITPTSTIGIRGTHFNIVHCANNCLNPDGSKSENGTFGSVTDGRIAVTNNAGEQVFGKSEYFFVASKDSLPQGLVAPPPFLRDRLEGQAKTRGKDKALTAGVGSETVATTSDTGASTQPAITAISPAIVSTTSSATTFTSAAQQGVASSVISFDFAFASGNAGIDYPSNHNTDASNGYVSFKGSLPSLLKDASAASIYTTGRSLLDLYLNGFGPITYDYDYPSQSQVRRDISSSKAAVDVGTSSAGNLTWGRTYDSYTTTVVSGPNAGATFSGNAYTHFVFGDPIAALPTSGSYLYNWVGGTSPTDSSFAVGTLTSGGSVNVNFGSQTISSATPITWTMSNTGASYSINFSGTLSMSTSTYTTGGLTVTTRDLSSVTGSGTCSPSCSVTSASVSPQFFGSSAQGLGLGISATGNGSFGTQKMATVQAYTR